jgi:hypothetical protein
MLLQRVTPNVQVDAPRRDLENATHRVLQDTFSFRRIPRAQASLTDFKKKLSSMLIVEAICFYGAVLDTLVFVVGGTS